MDDTTATGAWVRAQRQAQRLTQQALADAVGCSVTLIRKIESGKTEISPSLYTRIRTCLSAGGPARANELFAAWLPARRRALDLTQEELAARTCCAIATIRHLERGTRRPSPALATLLAEALDVPAKDRPAFIIWARGAAGATPPPSLTEAAHPAAAAPPLPLSPTSFIGRTQEVATVTGLLADARLITLTGPGGSGKTRLALAVAAAVQDHYPAGTWWVPLAAVTDPSEVLPEIATVLGVPPAAEVSLAENLRRALRGPARLLLLDNFEQGAAAAPAVAALLAGVPDLQILVTSRAALGVYGEHEVAVPPLALPPPDGHDLHTVAESEAVKLFVARARAVRPDFRLTPSSAPHVAAICARLDGLPLALELAAARTRLLSPAALLARLTDAPALRVLVGGARDLPARQQTLTAAIAWSYDLLAPADQALFAALGIFHGGATLEAIAAVTALPPETLEPQVETLLQQNLISAVHTADNPDVRIGMLETIRQFAVERLAERPDAATLAARHLAYYGNQARVREREYDGPTQLAVLAWWRQEAANLDAALQWGIAHDTTAAGELIWSLARYWLVNAAWDLAERHLRAVLAQALPIPLRVRLLRLQARHAAWRGTPATGEAAGREAVELARSLNDPAILAGALGSLGWLLYNQNNITEAEPLFEEGLGLSAQVGNVADVGDRLHNLGSCAAMRDDLDTAIRRYREAESLFRETKDLHGIAVSLMGLGGMYIYTHDFSRAEVVIEEARTLLESLDNRNSLSSCYLLGAWLALQRRHWAEAAQQISLAANRRFGESRSDIQQALDIGAGLALAQGDGRTALLMLAYSQSYADTNDPGYRRLRAPLEAEARQHLTPPVIAATITLGQALTDEEALAHLQRILAYYELPKPTTANKTPSLSAVGAA
jgi:predicted ATPase/transcriptional regulator with XRE-family HTH domain